jgi:hypothetical protein
MTQRAKVESAANTSPYRRPLWPALGTSSRCAKSWHAGSRLGTTQARGATNGETRVRHWAIRLNFLCILDTSAQRPVCCTRAREKHHAAPGGVSRGRRFAVCETQRHSESSFAHHDPAPSKRPSPSHKALRGPSSPRLTPASDPFVLSFDSLPEQPWHDVPCCLQRQTGRRRAFPLSHGAACASRPYDALAAEPR